MARALVIGSGGREHALLEALSRSPEKPELFVAPGNPGMEVIATRVPIKETDVEGLCAWCEANPMDLVVVGPEAPLVMGLHDAFEERPILKNIAFVGPGKLGAQLEGSKSFCKSFLERHGIPTARAFQVTQENLEEGMAFLETLSPPYVLKADGLAGGKGVLIEPGLEEAKIALRQLLDGQFGDASRRVLIEEFLHGIELSVFVLLDGTTGIVLPSAKDYKRVGDGDTGLNTGGMGAVSPVPFADEAFMQRVRERIVEPTIKGLEQDQVPYRGFLFIGLMNCGGHPFVIEFNVRMGDPETEVVFPRIRSDVFLLLKATGSGTLTEDELEVDERVAVTVVLASEGYPANPQTGRLLVLPEADGQDVHVFHSGTRTGEQGLESAGGRVAAVTALGPDISRARQTAYRALTKVSLSGGFYRNDIGLDL
jgi:phosphoribosylamine--glycine ligase